MLILTAFGYKTRWCVLSRTLREVKVVDRLDVGLGNEWNAMSESRAKHEVRWFPRDQLDEPAGWPTTSHYWKLQYVVAFEHFVWASFFFLFSCSLEEIEIICSLTWVKWIFKIIIISGFSQLLWRQYQIRRALFITHKYEYNSPVSSLYKPPSMRSPFSAFALLYIVNKCINNNVATRPVNSVVGCDISTKTSEDSQLMLSIPKYLPALFRIKKRIGLH